MRKKIRTITVDDRQYAWWYGIGERCARINLSPINDKTSKITVEFAFKNISDFIEIPPFIHIFPEYINMKKDNEEYSIKTIEPKMAGLLLSYLPYDAFISRKNIIYNGFDLLSEMGYLICEVKEGLYW